MSFVLISPEVVSAAAGDLANVGSTISAANKAAAAATTQVLAAGADEVSARIAALFGMYGLEYQAISAQVAAYHQQFVQTLRTGAASYMLAEATNVEQNLLNLINAPTQTLLGRPLIGDGANATTPGGAGGDGGLLFGSGGNGAPGAPARLAVPVGLPGYWAHIRRASSSTVWACTSKRPAMSRIACGSVIKREAMLLSPCLEVVTLLKF